ncbi:MAG: TRAP transporter substrate-binding protein DctP [Candidatus Marinimicrobia bacterium]|jgi:TRAP-type C4-dicarboxylate transport system substrate-binding protein|nr:TRAP transporter substrate-binding protein DctP [Candidatus Neomarinimicrobiota bacterium]
MRRTVTIILFLLSFALSRDIVVKMATLAPEGTDWHGMLIEMGQEWKDATKGKVKLRIYPGGVLGDERDMVRKMRIGQIHAAGMTAEGLSEIVSEFSGYFVPLVYQSSEDVQAVTDALLPDLESKLEENGFKLLYLGELTWVYWFSAEPIKIPADLKKRKFFTWAGDFKWEQVWKKAGYNPIPLATTDILSGLQTGLINTIPMPPIYALAQQSFGIANHMLNLKWGVLMAGIVVDIKTWNRIPKKYHDDLINITHSIQDKYMDSNRKAEEQAIEAMKQYGLTIHKINNSEMELWQSEVDRVSKYLRGNIIPESIYDTVIRLTDN